MQKVLLTGASGFIGQSVVPHLLARGYEVHAVSSKVRQSRSDVTWHRADLLSTDESARVIADVRPSHLLHLAWFVRPGTFWNAPENLDWLRASLFLARRFADCGGERIVTAGTCAEYDWSETGPFSETHSGMRPHTLYGAAKYSLYLTLEKFAQVSDLSFATGRIFFPFGPAEPAERFIPSVITSLLKKNAAETSHGDQIRDFMHVDDVASAFSALLGSDITGAVNIGSGTGSRLKDISRSIAKSLESVDLLKIGAIASREDEPAQIVADVQRLRDELKFETDAGLDTRLQETIDWWKRNL